MEDEEGRALRYAARRGGEAVGGRNPGAAEGHRAARDRAGHTHSGGARRREVEPPTRVGFFVNNERHHRDRPVRLGELQVWDVMNDTMMDHPFRCTASSSRSCR
jgi:hypothetical protein